MKKLFDFFRVNDNLIYKIILLITTILIITWLYPNKAQFKYNYQLGKPWLYNDLIAEYDFPIYKKAEDLKKEKEKITNNLKLFFNYDSLLTQKTLEKFKQNFTKSWQKDTFSNQYDYEKSLNFSYHILDTLLNKGIIQNYNNIKNKPTKTEAVLINSQGNTSYHLLSDFHILANVEKLIAKAVYHKNLDPKIYKDFIYKLLQDHLVDNITYDVEKNQSYKEKILKSISITKGMVQRGERVISRGEVISEENYRKLVSLEKDFNKKVGLSVNLFWIKLGQFILVASILSILFLFIGIFRKNIFIENKNIAFILLIIILMVWSTKLIITLNIEYLHVLPIVIFPLILRVFYDTRIASIIYLFSMLLLGFLVPNSFDFIALNSAVGIISIISIYNLNKRSRFFITALLIFITYSLIYSGLFLIKGGDIQSIEYKYYFFFAINAMLTLFAYPMIYIFEKIFGMVTDITLLELSDTNTPLLRELMTKAPGTFQHSLQVANLAEDAIREIGGNVLLVKTAALYHDIGKMNMPLFFIENQHGVNPHNELTHKESAKIILNHVIEGIEIAKKHRLPESVIDFIRTHHGTNKVEYFYRKQVMDNLEDEIDAEEFTYKGPKPFSKETAVLMMADSCEAASKSLSEPTEENISKLVENIINHHLKNGQFDNANITFKDISTVKKLITKRLMSIYHVRISYPEG